MVQPLVMAGMTLDQLRIFLAVAQHLHFTRAADELFITQPAVSAAIGHLEAEYGVKMFHRIGRHIEITEAGKLLQQEAQKILDQVKLTERGLRELNGLQRGELNLGSSLTIGNYWLPAKISQFQQRYPGITVNCTLANAETICAGTASGQFDLGLVEGLVQPALKASLEEAVIDRDRLLIVVGQAHPWFEVDELPLSALLDTVWVMREPGSGTQQRFEEALQNWGIELARLSVSLVLSSGEMIKSVVESGIAAAAISELLVEKELKLSILKAVTLVEDREGYAPAIAEIIRPFLRLKHRQRFQTRLSKAFEQILTEYPHKLES